MTKSTEHECSREGDIAAGQRAPWAKQKEGAIAKNISSPPKRATVKAAGKTSSTSLKKGMARNPPNPSAVKKSALVREAAAKVVPAKRLNSKIPPTQTKKNASPAPVKKAAGKKSLTKSLVSDPPPPGSGALAEAQAGP